MPLRNFDAMKLFSDIYFSFFNPGRPIFTGRFNRGFCPLLPLIFYVTCLPALFFSCAKSDPASTDCLASRDIHIRLNAVRSGQSMQEAGISQIQILVYNDDSRKLLDSRMFFEAEDGFEHLVCATSCTGNKEIVILCNLPRTFPEWADVLSIHSLERLVTGLETESLSFPVMSGSAKVSAGGEVVIMVKPLTARIRLREICCDFRGTAYPFEEITDVKVYLTNVNADSPLFPDRSYGRRFINNGSLNPLDINGFSDKGLIFRELGPKVGMDPVVTDMEFLCYANPVTEEAFGCPLTRLVIEGKILGKTWYWPIDLCKLQENGIQAGEDYEISLTILRTGTDDPDTPVRLVGGELEMEIVQWKEKENQPIYF